MGFEYFKTKYFPYPFKLNDMQVFFHDEKSIDVIRKVLDENGKIINFPGYVEDKRWLSEMNVGFFPDVRYEAQFYSIKDGKYLMLWLIQPNGAYWADEYGFGRTDDSSIMLYSVVNENGEFEKAFELFKINREKYCNDYDEYVK